MIIAGDVGGTNVRLALFENRGRSSPILQEKYASHDFADFPSLLKTFIGTLKIDGIAKACFGVAGPVIDGRCQTTNLPWVIDSAQLSKDLNIPQVWLINDLEANAWGLRALKPEEFLVLNPGTEQKGNAALISAGTGLGEAGLYWDGKVHHPFACEGGHCDWAPTSEEEVDLWCYLKRKFGHVSYERLLSGSGIYQIYRFLIDTKKEKEDPALNGIKESDEPQKIITEKGLKKQCPACVRTLNLFASIYGSEAGNLALKFLSTHGVYIGGGIAPKIIDVLKAGQFMKSFIAKGRFALMLSKIPVKVVLNDQTALLGAAQYAQEKN